MPNLNPAPKKPHTAGILSALASIVGFVALNSDTIAQYVPHKAAGAVILAGIAAQAVTKGIQHGDTDLVPKTNL
jgi:hypothetical protein